MKKLVAFIALVGLCATLYAPATVHACSCIAREYSQAEKMNESDAVFVGTVTDISQGELRRTVTFDVSAYWKGTISKKQTVTTASDSAACGYAFTVGMKYIVYANESDGRLTTGLCGFTTPADDAKIAALGTAMTPGGSATGSFNRNLGYGARGEDVRALQQYLNQKGFIVSATGAGSVGNETTYYGPATRSAVIRFQEAYKAELGISAGTGYFGPLTRTLINK
ncbi:MAG TPA: peptidoglycan-binding protein [Candidatus Paceibacterota bacterium]